MLKGLFAVGVPYACTLYKSFGELSGSVVRCLTWDRGVAGSSLTGDTALCLWARHINPCLLLNKSRKTQPDITKSCCWDVKNKIKMLSYNITCVMLSIFLNPKKKHRLKLKRHFRAAGKGGYSVSPSVIKIIQHQLLMMLKNLWH